MTGNEVLNPSLDQKASHHFSYRDLIECGGTAKVTKSRLTIGFIQQPMVMFHQLAA